jgi:hypothetical protein
VKFSEHAYDRDEYLLKNSETKHPSIPLACKYGRFNIADSRLDSILGEIYIKSLVIKMPRTETSNRGLARKLGGRLG